MEKPRTVTFKECELMAEGVGKTGIPWQKYQYYGDDGEHYVLFGKHDLEKPFTLVQESKPGKDGKVYTNWVIAKDGPSKAAGAGVKAIMDKLELIIAKLQQIESAVAGIAEEKTTRSISDAELPF